jgi:hypothetical protein
MLNNNDFIALERRLWAEGNPLADELASTRDELKALMVEAGKVVHKYSKSMAMMADADDLDFFREWDNFIDYLDNVAYDIGEIPIQRMINEGHF